MSPRWSNISSGLYTGGTSGLLSRLPLIGKLGRDELRVLVQPHQLVLTRLGGWRKQRVICEDVITIARPSPAMAGDAGIPAPAIWQAALTQLALALRDQAWQGCQPRVVLSNHLVRYVLIPWNASLSRPEEKHAFVRHCFTQAYGEPARQWDLRVSPAGYGQATIASGVDPALLQALQHCFAEAGMRLQHIHPLLMQAINETARQRSKRAGKGKRGTASASGLCLAVLEQGRIAVLLQQDKQWRSVQCHSAHVDALPALIQRDAILAGLDSQPWPVVVYSAEPGAPRVHISGRALQQFSREIPFVRQPGLAETAS